MPDLVKPGIAIAAIAALGIGCYTWGQHKAADSVPSPYPMATTSPQSTITTTTVPAGGVPLTTTATPNLLPTTTGGQPVVNSTASMADPQVGAATTTNTNTRTVLPGSQTMSQTTSTTNTIPVAPVATVPYAGTTVVTPAATSSDTTYVEKKTVQTTAPRHVAYTSHTVHYSKHHKTDKVHIARGAKHGVMFALKLPGRAAF